MSTVRVRKCGYCREIGHNSRTCPKKLQDLYLQQQAQSEQQPQSEQQNQTTSEQKSAEQPVKPGKTDLGYIQLGARRVFVSLIPSQTESVIVKYQPGIQISCVIPPQEHTAMYDYGRGVTRKKPLKITSPYLIMGCPYSDVPNPTSFKRVVQPYTLWVIDTVRKDNIYVKPYLFSNVWNHGKVCFGGLKPASLRQAYNIYWSSGFNAELFREEGGIKHICTNKRHNYRFHQGHSCNPAFKQHSCQCSRKTFHRHNTTNGQRGGCGCTSVSASKSCKGACDYAEETRCDCCTAIKARQATAKTEDPNIGVRKLGRLARVDGEPYPGCGCNFRHKRGCGCAKNTCSCPCTCPCCSKTCDHGVCRCSCCKEQCSCPCRCSAGEMYRQHLETYHDIQVKRQKWAKRSQVFCGTKFWAAPKGADGVLLSNERILLSAIPKKFWRKDQHGNPIVIALANRHKDGYWEFESGGFTFRLSPEHVVSK